MRVLAKLGELRGRDIQVQGLLWAPEDDARVNLWRFAETFTALRHDAAALYPNAGELIDRADSEEAAA